MNKNIIKFNKPYISNSTKKNLLKVLKNKSFADGEFQTKSENVIKNLVNSKSIKLTQNCTSALEVAMILININKGDEVILPSYTFTSTANCILLRGAKPVFADINKHDLNISAESVEKKINKKTKAIIVVHYGGISCDMDSFLRLKKKYNLYLIEDAAHAFMGKFNKRNLGTIGDFGTFSFHETKNVVGGQCGALSINNSKFLNRANIVLDKGTDRLLKTKKNYYSWKDVGSEFRAPELSAALLFSQLEDIKKIQYKRKIIWNNYFRVLAKIKSKLFFLPYKYNFNIESAYHVFPVIFKSQLIRDKFIKFMKSKGIECYFHYYPLHKSTFGKKISKNKLVNTEIVYNGLVRFPLYPDLSTKNQKKILKFFQLFLNKITSYKI